MSENTRTILLVEDEAATALAEKRQLETIGHDVHHVATGEEAVAAVLDGHSRFDLVLMDIDLGAGIDGTQAAEQILNAVDIPVMFLSSHTEPDIVAKTEKITSYGYVVKNAGLTVLDASIKMALKLCEANRRILINERLQSKIISNIGDVIVIVDRKGVNRYKSPNITQLFGWKPEELVGESTWDVVHPDDREAAGRFFDSIVSEPEARGKTELRYKRKDGQFVWIEITMANLLSDPYIQGLLGNYHDITARKRDEEHMRILARIAESENTMIVVTDADRRTLWTNEAFRKISGYGDDEMIGSVPGRVLQGAEPDEDLNAHMRSALDAGESFQCEIQNFAKSGTAYWIQMDIQPVYDQNRRLTHFVAVQHNITERKRAEEEIQRQLSEKDIFLKEVHHRIKNNMSQVEGFLSLQANSTGNSDVRAALQEAIARVQSTRVLYEKLLITTGYEAISVKEYIESLIEALIAVFPEHTAVTVEKKIADFTLKSKKAIPLGIILNELMTNALKYAFEHGNHQRKKEDRISIHLARTGPEAVLTIRDNGTGIRESVAADHAPSFGLAVVTMLAEQLGGTYVVENDNGTKNIVTFDVS